MKKQFTFLFFTLMAVSTHAQVWVDNNAVWHYDYWNVAQEGFYEISHTHDTLIDGKLCKAFGGTRYSYGIGPDGGTVTLGESNLGTNYTYVSGDTIFYRNNEAFFVMLNFGAEVGDSWIISTTPFWEECDDTSRIEVIETGTMTIGGESYRTLTVEPTSNSPMGFRGQFIERFGNIQSELAPFQYLFPSHYGCDSIDGIFEFDFMNFKCFEDDSFTLYNPSGETCDWWRVNVGLAEDDLIPLTVFPNPSTGQIIISGIDPQSHVELYNIAGEKLRGGPLENNILDLSNFEDGIYLLRTNGLTKRVVLMK